jgi:hypothetical protein
MLTCAPGMQPGPGLARTTCMPARPAGKRHVVAKVIEVHEDGNSEE